MNTLRTRAYPPPERVVRGGLFRPVPKLKCLRRVFGDEGPQGRGHLCVRVDGTLSDGVGDIGGRVPGPALDRIEDDNPDGVAVVAGDNEANDCLKIGFGLVGLAPGAPGAGAEVLEDEINVAVEAIGRHDRGRGTHTQTPKTALTQSRVRAGRSL